MVNGKLTRAGPVLGAERAGQEVFTLSPLTRLLGHGATRCKRHSKKSVKNHGETIKVIS